MRPLPLLFVFLLTVSSAFAQPFVCGTSPENDDRLAALDQWAAAREQIRFQKGRPARNDIALNDSVVILEADDLTAPFLRSFDLAERSLIFTPTNGGYTVRNVPLEYETDFGSSQRFTTMGSTITWTPKFGIPFYGRTLTRFQVGDTNVIFPDEPVALAEFDQYTDLELASHPQAMISPLLMTRDGLRDSSPTVYVRETADFVVVTWKMDRGDRYTVQATLYRDGRIRYSYIGVEQIFGGGVVLTSGAQGWRGEMTVLASQTDAENDTIPSTPAATSGMYDIVSASLERAADSNLLEVRIRLRTPINRAALTQSLLYTVDFGDRSLGQRYTLSVRTDGGDVYTRPELGQIVRSPAARVNGDTITMTVLQDSLILYPPARITVASGPSTQRFDEAVIVGNVGDFSSPVRRDFSAATGEVMRGAAVEAFTLPILNPSRVSIRVRNALALNPAEFDGLAIYQNFRTDIDFYASAYATGGNAAVDGISLNIRSGTTRSPTLMHMNRVGYGPNRNEKAAGHVVLHELGHRWLLFIRIMENGAATTSLNPISAHPAQYVDTRAAFPVYSNADSSVMGGSTFSPDVNGTFSASAYGSYSYSWLDLYLMGLAEPPEVQPWFYLAGAIPELGGAYYPPPGINVTATRKDVTVQQVIDAMGPRKPAYPESQKKFRVAVVLLTSPERPVTGEEIATVTSYRRLLETNFRAASGGRGEVITDLLPPSVTRRRASR